jgi:hypothetical protein
MLFASLHLFLSQSHYPPSCPMHPIPHSPPKSDLPTIVASALLASTKPLQNHLLSRLEFWKLLIIVAHNVIAAWQVFQNDPGANPSLRYYPKSPLVQQTEQPRNLRRDHCDPELVLGLALLFSIARRRPMKCLDGMREIQLFHLLSGYR